MEFVDHHARDDITITDIAGATDIGARALQSAFRRLRGQTPHDYLRWVRMAGAHRDLLAADRVRGDTVGAVAARWRFSNPGRFATHYQDRYGRPPRETLAHTAAGNHRQWPPTEATPDTSAAPTRSSRSDESDRAVEVALLDTRGVIVWVNRAWNEFCSDNGGDPTRAGVGRSYLAICDAAGARDPYSVAVAAAIRTAVHGRLPTPVRISTPCPTPRRTRTFDVLISTRRHDDGRVLGATLTLSEARPPDRELEA